MSNRDDYSLSPVVVQFAATDFGSTAEPLDSIWGNVGIVRHLSSRKMEVGRQGGRRNCFLVSLSAGAFLAALIWIWPDWIHQHVPERTNVFIEGLMPLGAGASVFLVRWFVSPYPVYKKLCRRADSKQKGETIRKHLYSYLFGLEDRFEHLRRMDAQAVLIFDMYSPPRDDQKFIDEIFGYINENISLACGGEFLSNTGLSRAMHQSAHSKQLELLNNRRRDLRG